MKHLTLEILLKLLALQQFFCASHKLCKLMSSVALLTVCLSYFVYLLLSS